MVRSTFINQLLKSFIDPNGFHVMSINDGEEVHRCNNFKEACEIIDSVDEVGIHIVDITRSNTLGWCLITLLNDGIEQLVDHTDNDYMNNRYKRLEKKYG